MPECAPIVVISGPSGVGKSTVSRLCAAAFDPSAHIRADDVIGFVVNGWVNSWLPDSAQQNEVVGGALAAAAIAFARGVYTAVVDGHLFPAGLEGLAEACAGTGVPLHYTVLHADLATCWDRAIERGRRPNREQFSRLHARFDDLGRYEAHTIDATNTPEEVAASVLAAIDAGRCRA